MLGVSVGIRDAAVALEGPECQVKYFTLSSIDYEGTKPEGVALEMLY